MAASSATVLNLVKPIEDSRYRLSDALTFDLISKARSASVNTVFVSSNCSTCSAFYTITNVNVTGVRLTSLELKH